MKSQTLLIVAAVAVLAYLHNKKTNEAAKAAKPIDQGDADAAYAKAHPS